MRYSTLMFLTYLTLLISTTPAQADMFDKLKDTLNKKAKEVVDEVKRDATGSTQQRGGSKYDCDFPTRDGCPTTTQDLKNAQAKKGDSQGERCFYGNIRAQSTFSTAPVAQKVCLSELEKILYPTKHYTIKDDMTLAKFPFDVFGDCNLTNYEPYEPITDINTFTKVSLECADNNAREIAFETQSGQAGKGIFMTGYGYYVCAPDPNFKGSKFDKALRAKYGEPTEEQIDESTKPKQIMTYRWCASGKCKGRGQDSIESLRVMKDGKCNTAGYSQYKVELYNGTVSYQKWRDHIQKISIEEREGSYEPDL